MEGESMLNLRLFIMVSSVLLMFNVQSSACSSFLLPNSDGAVLSKSYDWHLKHGLMVVNKRNVKKESLSILPSDRTLEWTSEYGSVTFNQYGREFPLGGINEEGLMIEVLWLNSSDYPDPDGRPSVNELQWIQYMLDSASKLEDVKTLAKRIRISPVTADVHYLVCDQLKRCGTFEYLNRKLVVSAWPRIVAPSLTNHPYKDSQKYLKTFLGFGGNKSLPTGGGSLDRFVRASIMAKNFDKNDQKHQSAINYAMAVLDNVNMGEYSKWNIVYDYKRNEVQIKNRWGDFETKVFHPKDFNYSCKTPVDVLRIDSVLDGDVQDYFQDYRMAENLRIVDMSVGGEFPQWLIQKIVSYPDNSTRCMN